jgi:hypothetical protein
MPADSPELRRAYEDRAVLLAVLAAIYPARLCANDPEWPDWPVLYIDIPTGQVSWHINPDDTHLFRHAHHIAPNAPGAPVWDGHTREERNDRLTALVRSLW